MAHLLLFGRLDANTREKAMVIQYTGSGGPGERKGSQPRGRKPQKSKKKGKSSFSSAICCGFINAHLLLWPLVCAGRTWLHSHCSLSVMTSVLMLANPN